MTVPGSGPKTAVWAVLGEAPGATEARQGRPFVGQSGRLLRDTLEKVGLNPDEAYITNVVKDRPEGNRTPTAAEIKEAIPALVEELRSLPNLRGILCVGAVPLSALTGLTGITKHRGLVPKRRKDTEDLATDVFATLHPAAILRNRNYYNGWLQDLAAFQQLIYPPQEKVEWTHVNSDETYRLFLAAALAGGEMASLDVETTIGDPFQQQVDLVLLGVSFDGEHVFIFEDDRWLNRAIMGPLSQQQYVMHNGYFDTMMLNQLLNWKPVLKHDTMAMAYVLYPEERKSLQILSSVFLGLPPYKDVDYDNILDEPFEKVAHMNAIDVCRTFKLFRPLADELNKNSKLRRTYLNLLLPAIRTLVTVTENGVPIDQVRLNTLAQHLQRRLESLDATLKAQTPSPLESVYGHDTWRGGSFNPNSPQQVSHLLFDLLGATPVRFTDTGAPSTDEAVLLELKIQGGAKNLTAFLDLLLDYRSVAKAVSSYTNSWPRLLGSDGRLHPRYKPLHVVTGRLSSERPNIQQVPRTEEFRSVFGGVPGFKWVKADLSQIELRIAAWLAQEENMLQAYWNGEDLHTLTAVRVLGEPEARQVGKTLNFGLLYGAYPKKLKEVAFTDYGVEMSLTQAREYHDGFFRAYPSLAEWHENVRRKARNAAKVRSPLGRVRYLPDARSDDDSKRWRAEREALNMPVQSMASDMLLHSLTVLDDRGYGKYLTAEVHDEIDFLVPELAVDDLVPEIKEVMEDTEWLAAWGIDFNVPVVAEVTVGDYWSG